MVAIKKPRGKMVTVVCKCGCKKEFQAREADVKRGWGKYFDKSHKAIEQEKRTGANAAFQARRADAELRFNEVDYEGPGWDAHKGSF